MAYLQNTFPIVEKYNLAKNIYDYRIAAPELAAQAQAGQFVHIRVPGHLLRRPISIAEINREKGILRIIFEIRGEGTQALSELNKGDLIDVLGPLGHGYTPVKPGSRVVAVGGGIGVPPLFETVRGCGANGAAILGFRNAQAVVLEKDFKDAGVETILCTDDGSMGRKGFVTDALEDYLSREKVDKIVACGPTVMLKKVVAIAQKHHIDCEISLEERMACGVGACLGCACRILRGGEEQVLHVCKDGPVFKGEEVLF